MSEYEVDENGEVVEPDAPQPDENEQAEEAESEDTFSQSDSDEPGQDGSAAEDDPAPEDSHDQPEPHVGDAQIEKNSKAMNRAAEAYVKKAIATLGDDLGGLQRCPLCAEGWPGLRFPIMPEPEYLAATRVAIGLEPGDNLPKDNYSRVCQTCDGWGRVDTGSKVPAQASATCYDCQGKGWVAVGDERKDGSITALPPNPNGDSAAERLGIAGEPPEAQALRDLGFIVTKVPNIAEIVS